MLSYLPSECILHGFKSSSLVLFTQSALRTRGDQEKLQLWKGYYVEAGIEQPLSLFTDLKRPRTIGTTNKVIGGLLLHTTRK